MVRVGDQEVQTTVDKLDKQVLGQDRDASHTQGNMASYDSEFQRCITRKNAEPLCCVPETNKIFQLKRRQIKLVLYTLFQKTEENSMFPNSFCEVSLTQIPKSDKDMKRKNHRQISLLIDVKILNKTQANLIQ